MELTGWYVVIGALLILLVLVRARVARWPISTAMIYLGLGWGFGLMRWIDLDPLEDAKLLEHLSEIAVILSLFSAGLKLRLPLDAREWRLPGLLAFVSMTLTVGLVALVGHYVLQLPLGAAVLLGAVLSPTDPVLASDVQVAHPHDTDRLRFTLTGEAGMNDGTAFPFVMLGLGLLGLHDLGAGGWRWWTVDVAWAIVGGLAIGTLLGMAVGQGVVYLRRAHREAVGLDDFLALGLIAFVYGIALLLHTYGFLAVFAAGLALRRVERHSAGDEPPPEMKKLAAEDEELASHPEYAPAYMAEAVLQFNSHLERIGELSLVLIAGALLATERMSLATAGVGLALFCVIRPLAVAPLAWWCGMTRLQTGLASWFGVRGVGSIYYLFYAIRHGVPEPIADKLVSITLGVLAFSVLLHGMSVTPLMKLYQRQVEPSRSTRE